MFGKVLALICCLQQFKQWKVVNGTLKDFLELKIVGLDAIYCVLLLECPLKKFMAMLTTESLKTAENQWHMSLKMRRSNGQRN